MSKLHLFKGKLQKFNNANYSLGRFMCVGPIYSINENNEQTLVREHVWIKIPKSFKKWKLQGKEIYFLGKYTSYIGNDLKEKLGIQLKYQDKLSTKQDELFEIYLKNNK